MSTAATSDFDPYHKWLGIPPSEQPPNYYRLLGLSEFEDDADVIAAAADRQMGHVKSFAMGRHAAHSQQLLNELARVRVCLLNPKLKPTYDAKLRAELVPKPATPPPAPAATSAPPSQFNRPPKQAASAAPPATARAEPAELPEIGPSRAVRRRRKKKKSSAGPILLAMAIAALVLTGLAIYLANKTL